MRRLLAAATGLIVALALSGCDSPDAMRTQFVALRYLQSAEGHLASLPRDAQQARNELDRALALQPDDIGLRDRAAPLYVMARAYETAIPLLETRASEDRLTAALLAQCLLATGETERGTEILRSMLEQAGRKHKAGEIGPGDFAIAMNTAGYLLADGGQELDRAHQAIKAAVSFAPTQPAFIDSLGWVLYRKGKYQDAAFYLERAMRLSQGDDPEMLYHLGATYARLGRLRDADRLLRRARDADPGTESVELELKRLGRTLVPPLVQA